GNRLIDAGHRPKAIRAYHQALDSEADHLPALYGLAAALAESGRHDEARRYWRRYLACETDGECAAYAQRQLSGGRVDRDERCSLPFFRANRFFIVPVSDGRISPISAQGSAVNPASRVAIVLTFHFQLFRTISPTHFAASRRVHAACRTGARGGRLLVRREVLF